MTEVPEQGQQPQVLGADEKAVDDEGGCRPEMVDKALKALLGDAERCEGELQRDDVNRIYVRRELSIPECIAVEMELQRRGVRLLDAEDDDSYEEDSSTTLLDRRNLTRRTRYLSASEEKELGRRIQLASRLAESGGSGNADYDKRVIDDANKARAALVATNKRFVAKLARDRPLPRHMTLEDLIQEGFIGLLRATESFDPELNFRFKTYAAWWIAQKIHRAVEDGDRIVRLPVHVQDKLRRIRRSERKLTLANGRRPSPEELADALGVSKEKLAKFLWHVEATDCVDGDTPIRENSAETLITLRPDETAPSAFELLALGQLREQFSTVLAKLTPREEQVLRMRFGIDAGEGQTLESIGKKFGVTRERIRQIEEKALRKLRKPSIERQFREFLE